MRRISTPLLSAPLLLLLISPLLLLLPLPLPLSHYSLYCSRCSSRLRGEPCSLSASRSAEYLEATSYQPADDQNWY